MLGAYVRSLAPGLPRSVWIMEAGGLVNAVGNGMTFPFLVIYLHNVRGFSLATAGFVIAAGNAIGLVAGPVSGPIVDRLGGRLTLAIGLILMAIGFTAYPFVDEPWEAYAAALTSPASATASSGRASPRSSPVSRRTTGGTRPSRCSASRATSGSGSAASPAA